MNFARILLVPSLTYMACHPPKATLLTTTPLQQLPSSIHDLATTEAFVYRNFSKKKKMWTAYLFFGLCFHACFLLDFCSDSFLDFASISISILLDYFATPLLY
jgi:hypothetical protein